MRPIMKEGVRILRPVEYEKLMAVLPNKGRKYAHREIINALLYTGMRYVELQRFHAHDTNPKNKDRWFDEKSRSIYLPKEASLKKKRKMRDRYVYLSAQGVIHIGYFLRYVDAMPRREVMDNQLKKWGKKAGIEHVSVKTFRKTWESWLVVSYREEIPLIAMNQGHTTLTAMHHYLNIPFSNDDIETIKVMTAGWAGLKPKEIKM